MSISEGFTQQTGCSNREARPPSRQPLACSLFAVVVLLVAWRAGYALEYGDLTFYAPFEGSHDAVIARGDPRSQVSDKRPTFTDGVIGKALVAGQEDVGISYDINRNFNDRSFTLSLWMKALNWKPRE